jgi:hypothetical protein
MKREYYAFGKRVTFVQWLVWILVVLWVVLVMLMLP